jgi:hypothetical protein
MDQEEGEASFINCIMKERIHLHACIPSHLYPIPAFSSGTLNALGVFHRHECNVVWLIQQKRIKSDCSKRS